MADLQQYLELLGRGAQAAQWGLYVGLANLLLLLVNLILVITVMSQAANLKEESILRLKRTGLEKPPPPPPPGPRR